MSASRTRPWEKSNVALVTAPVGRSAADPTCIEGTGLPTVMSRPGESGTAPRQKLRPPEKLSEKDCTGAGRGLGSLDGLLCTTWQLLLSEPTCKLASPIKSASR